MTTTETTIEGQILDQLHRLDPDADDLIRLSTVLRRIDGTFWAKQEAVTALFDRSEIAVVKINGVPYIGLCDGLCQDANTAALQRGEPRKLLVL
ncbi:hypothetical protein HCA61_13830 [Rhodococcus sp. HNM0563]|uniref:hypothetical protein n=1 Tax=Rhodococcus sp. HNM0563 TaxID=2716339 RepID=UPI00146F6E74|nr:hypothetical protein [Rhodococcus sp. HNM0563]NLU63341.1 hypothetical protein [Rhodococcus sp. HNM0563]